MKENLKFTGRRYEEKEKESLEKNIHQWSLEAMKPMDGELEKSEEDVKMIETINSIVHLELQSLGITDYEPIPLKKIHILSGDIFEKNFPNSDDIAFFLSANDAVYLNKDKTDTKARIFSSLLHEIIHRASTQKFYVENKNGGSAVYDARVGYRIRSAWKDPRRENRLIGFNELMVDFTAYKILVNNSQYLEKLGITKKDIQGPIYTYMHYGPILNSIIEKISKDKKISKLEVIEGLERGQFESNILVLKNIEQSFGKGSLEILSFLQVLENEEDNIELEKMIKDFFTEDDEQKRQDLRAEIKKFVKESLLKTKPKI